MMKNAVIALAQKIGFWEMGYVDMTCLQYHPEVRGMCEKNTCRSYGTTWACPPAVGTLEECRRRIEQYDTMLLFTGKYDLEDSFDFEGMMAGLHDFKKKVDAFAKGLDALVYDCLLLSNEGCGRCKTCTYPTSPCRFPEKLHHSLEGYGFLVSELAAHAGIRYINGENTVTYFGALFFNR